VEPFNARQLLGIECTAIAAIAPLGPLAQSCSPTACEKEHAVPDAGNWPSLKLHRLSLLECRRSGLSTLQHHTRRSNHACFASLTPLGTSNLSNCCRPSTPDVVATLIKSRILSLHLGTHPLVFRPSPTPSHDRSSSSIVTTSATHILAPRKELDSSLHPQ
jgi:hypothetical protein